MKYLHWAEKEKEQVSILLLSMSIIIRNYQNFPTLIEMSLMTSLTHSLFVDPKYKLGV